MKLKFIIIALFMLISTFGLAHAQDTACVTFYVLDTDDESASEGKSNDSGVTAIVAGFFIIFILVIAIFAINGMKNKSSTNADTITESIDAENDNQFKEQQIAFRPVNKNKDEIGNSISNFKKINCTNKNMVLATSAYTYKEGTVQYKVKIDNPTPEPIADIKINIQVPVVCSVSECVKTIPIIKSLESKTVTFDIEPIGECGECEVSGKIEYYDYSLKETKETIIPVRNISIIGIILKPTEIDENDWRNIVVNLNRAEEFIEEIDMPGPTLFDVISDILKDINLFRIEPKISDSSNAYRSVAKFYAVSIKSLKYAVQIEVVGNSSKSKLILKAWAESEDSLAGFHHIILNEINKRVH